MVIKTSQAKHIQLNHKIIWNCLSVCYNQDDRGKTEIKLNTTFYKNIVTTLFMLLLLIYYKIITLVPHMLILWTKSASGLTKAFLLSSSSWDGMRPAGPFEPTFLACHQFGSFWLTICETNIEL